MLLTKLLFFDFDELLLLKALSLLPGPTLPLILDVLAPPASMLPNLLFTRFNLIPLLRQLTREVSARSR
jgi:hypothetical protein